MGSVLSHERNFNAGAEAVQSAEGNMSGAAMRGTVALPGSETRSRTKGARRNLGDLILPTAAQVAAGHDGKLRRRSRRGRGEESDDRVVPMKPRTTPIDGSVAETVEERRSAGGTVSRNACPGHSAGSGMSPTRQADGLKQVWAAQAPSFDRV